MTGLAFELRNVSRRFAIRRQLSEHLSSWFGYNQPKAVHALSDVSLKVSSGEVLGIVGESGCGKSTLARIMAGLVKPSEGEVYFEGQRVDELGERERVNAMLPAQLVFQNPFSSLNPRHRIRTILSQAALLHDLTQRNHVDEFVSSLLQSVGLPPSVSTRFAHEFSGGQLQRISLARSLSVSPRVLICDEPVSALDVSVQAQILNLLLELQTRQNLTYIIISHDLSVIRHLSDRVAVMYLGRVVEEGPAAALFENPQHPYTQALVRESLESAATRRLFKPIEGEIPSPINLPSGCGFHPRCPVSIDRCRLERPELRSFGPGRKVACHLVEADHSQQVTNGVK
ncbi:ABC transporter ATP-binding protein [uncultured Hoeflea sp.]|uniref:ABC transporter ATP-binding protein n=1 Tax=uncultured Hoeflea sp. TaxID=538666 RepID=UPI00262B0FB0|nr:ABC transporter ATP-binding protein [uncultured Hoeflea sp.]